MRALENVVEQADKPNLDLTTGIGVALFIAGCGLSVGLIHLRGKTVTRLWSDIDIAHESLTGKAFSSLERLKSHIDGLLPDTGVDFDPLDVIADPSTVIKPAKVSIRLLRERHQVKREFWWLLRVCSILKYFVLSATIALGATTATYQFFFAEAWLWQLLLKVTGGLVLGSLIFGGTYATLVARVDGAIEKSKPVAADAGVVLR
ncbi:hypothetical protein [Arthrobacter sp. ov118]|uniref:hypothetical protein n=1 Tax=Arthrobacter sp. ov118 TaxID=1761747 RepID=UPI0008EE92BD|nr:hypothetical protein [Arthrobacter sp. ov118]SFT44627.1 hypothetical protein SAMN04487915_101410 [Arthrobacter sp. ov118]